MEDVEDADVEAFDVVDEVRCKEEASEDTVDSRDAVSGRLTLYRLGRLYRSIGDLYEESVHIKEMYRGRHAQRHKHLGDSMPCKTLCD